MNEDPETMERIAVNKVTNALRNYRTSCEREIQRRKRNLLKATVRRRRQRDEEESTGKGEGKRTVKLFDGRGGKEKVLEEEDMIQSKSDDDQQEMVKRLLQEVYEKGERKSREAVEKNQHFFDCLLETFSSNDADGEDASHLPAHLRVTRDFETVPERERPPLVPGFEDAEKARYVLKNLARDWSEEGREEREKSHDVLVRHLRDVVFKEQLSEIDLMCERMNPEDIARPRVLVPGAGLGRLVYEFAKAGFETEGNEFSYYMLFGSSFLLNCCSEKRPFEIVPYWHSPLNHLSQKDQYRSIVVPDESPCDHMDAFKPGSSMAMCAGDFCEVYGSPEYESHFDAVACCFFLDTAKNIFDYLETIRFCLKKGGTLTSIGPLLWHWVEHSDNNLSLIHI